MKRLYYYFIGMMCVLPIQRISAETVEISTPNNTLALFAKPGTSLEFLYYGEKLSDTDLRSFADSQRAWIAGYPVFGMYGPQETALSIIQNDGNATAEFKVQGVEKNDDDISSITTITFEDSAYPVTLKLHYRAYNEVDMIETWSEIVNNGKKPVTLTQYASAYLPIHKGNVWLSSLYGAWGNEGQVETEALTFGMKEIKNKDGVRNTHFSHPEVMFSLDGKPCENTGRVIGAALCYTGNYSLRIDTDFSDYHHFFAGINEDNSAYTLKGGGTFTTPPVALTYSGEGLSGASRNFHKWGRKYKLAHGDTERKILLNSWEGIHMDVNEPELAQMMQDIADMGGELFVMDDGWFGEKYPRKRDDAGLGDWVVDKEKLPNGIESLIETADKIGIKFGLWIEPEMANTNSELYDKHPDWIVKAANRQLVTGRGGTQVVLDLCNPKVQDYVVGIVDNIITKYPGLDYIKWDANMNISNYGSQHLPMSEQSHFAIEWHKGLEKICKRIREKYPEITLQSCASGGGRVNWGFMPYFDEFWTSDNTDALQRIYMQWGTSYFFPAIAMASHISATPNHQTLRTTPLKFRADVAMAGRLGIEMQPKDMTAEEREFCSRALADYKKIRPVVQFGNIYRLLSPFEHKGLASLMYVSDEKEKAVFYWWRTEHFVNEHFPIIPMAGLDPNKNYKVTELTRIDNVPLRVEGKVFSGKYLMTHGLDLPYGHNVDSDKRNSYASRVLYLEQVDGYND
ncbi:MAG: alpha-galactosidase [Muribaculaceae bacterium]|nr:alpha-galactosidase [Muribaculaceae bacterium]